MVFIKVGMNDNAAYALLHKLLSMHCSLISQSDLFTGNDEQIWLRNLSPIVCMWFKKATLVPLITVLGREQTKALFLKYEIAVMFVFCASWDKLPPCPVCTQPLQLPCKPPLDKGMDGWMDGYIVVCFLRTCGQSSSCSSLLPVITCRIVRCLAPEIQTK